MIGVLMGNVDDRQWLLSLFDFPCPLYRTF
jgi:hypothetical protein